MSHDDKARNQGGGINRLLSSFILVVILVMILVVGYLIVDTILALRQPVTSANTQIQQILNPTPTIIADPVTVVRQVRSLSRLETASYTIEKVITAQSGEGPLGFLFQDKLLLVAQGEVIAGVDLGRVGEENVQVVQDTVFITLPASEIFVATLDNDATYVYDRQTGVFGQQIDLETLARQEAEKAILQAALEDGILNMAQDKAEQVIRNLMEAVGFNEVVFVRGTPAPDQNRGEK
ncbi:MAG: DUF4230 domain-containing protein [Anaerolineae bacterium]|nr:DUF4230 domain-containing protein [Anaerolineae bacterium]